MCGKRNAYSCFVSSHRMLDTDARCDRLPNTHCFALIYFWSVQSSTIEIPAVRRNVFFPGHVSSLCGIISNSKTHIQRSQFDQNYDHDYCNHLIQFRWKPKSKFCLNADPQSFYQVEKMSLGSACAQFSIAFSLFIFLIHLVYSRGISLWSSIYAAEQWHRIMFHVRSVCLFAADAIHSAESFQPYLVWLRIHRMHRCLCVCVSTLRFGHFVVFSVCSST